MNKINMTPVESSNVLEVGYKPTTKELYVTFRNGTYIYSDVSQNTYLQLLQSVSKGKFINANIIGSYDEHKQS